MGSHEGLTMCGQGGESCQLRYLCLDAQNRKGMAWRLNKYSILSARKILKDTSPPPIQ